MRPESTRLHHAADVLAALDPTILTAAQALADGFNLPDGWTATMTMTGGIRIDPGAHVVFALPSGRWLGPHGILADTPAAAVNYVVRHAGGSATPCATCGRR